MKIEKMQWADKDKNLLDVWFYDSDNILIPYTLNIKHKEFDGEVGKYIRDSYLSSGVTIEEYNNEFISLEIRDKRNNLLNATDKLLTIPDFPISESEKEEVRQYRQLLRDITKQDGFPENITWPDQPECIKKYI